MALVVPVVALGAIWGLTVRDSVTGALVLRNADNTRDQVVLPCARVLTALQAERSSSHEFQATGRQDATELRARRAVTDAAIADFLSLKARYNVKSRSADITRTRLADMTTALGTLTRLRAQIDAGDIIRVAVLNAYTGIITTTFGVLASAAALGEIEVERTTHAVLDVARVGELLSQEDALLTGAGTEGRFADGEYLVLLQVVGALRFQIPTAGSALPTDVRVSYQNVFSSPAFAAVRAAEDKIVRNGRPGGPVPVNLRSWKASYGPVSQQLEGFVLFGYGEAVAQANRAGAAILLRFGIFGVMGLLALATSLILAVRIGRSVVRRLSLLRSASADLAGRQLPEVMARLRAGEHVDVETETMRPAPGDDEIAEVGAALAEVQRSAIRSAVGEAALRQGLGKVLVNVARRNQGLIDRQLEAIAQIPAQDTRPVVLARQLATRMRRYAEHLVILAGSARIPGGRQPQPLAQLVVAAAGDLQDTDRIVVGSIADVELPARVAADLTHVLTELMDNALSFSPPDTQVQVSSTRAPHGVAVTIEDRGLGMTPAAIEETNRWLAQPPDFDPTNSARLGLYVVAVLATQRGITVELERSHFGGITAVVLIPPELTDSHDMTRSPDSVQVGSETTDPTGSLPSASTLSAALAGMHRRNSTR